MFTNEVCFFLVFFQNDSEKMSAFDFLCSTFVLNHRNESFFNCSFLLVDSNFSADGRKEEVHFDKITSRIQKLCYGLDMDYVDPVNFLTSFFIFFSFSPNNGQFLQRSLFDFNLSFASFISQLHVIKKKFKQIGFNHAASD